MSLSSEAAVSRAVGFRTDGFSEPGDLAKLVWNERGVPNRDFWVSFISGLHFQWIIR